MFSSFFLCKSLAAMPESAKRQPKIDVLRLTVSPFPMKNVATHQKRCPSPMNDQCCPFLMAHSLERYVPLIFSLRNLSNPFQAILIWAIYRLPGSWLPSGWFHQWGHSARVAALIFFGTVLLIHSIIIVLKISYINMLYIIYIYCYFIILQLLLSSHTILLWLLLF